MPLSWMPKKRTLQDELSAEVLRNWLETPASTGVPPWSPPKPTKTKVAEVLPTARVAAPTIERPGRVQWQPTMIGQEEPLPTTRRPTYQLPGVVERAETKEPVLPKILKPIGKAFEWYHRTFELPWASIITSPFAPDLPWHKGETYMQHKIREYEAWNAPKFAKGMAEFSMPIGWLPFAGWGAKGLMAMGAGAKVVRAGRAMMKVATFELPTDEMLNGMFKADIPRKMAWWAENKPIVHQIVKAVFGPASFVRPPVTGETYKDIALRSVAKYQYLGSEAESYAGGLLPKVQQFGDPFRALNMAKEGPGAGIVKAVEPKVKGASQYLTDVVENPNDYKFLTKEAEDYIKNWREIEEIVRGWRFKEGMNVPEKLQVHRPVLGKNVPEGYAKSTSGALFEAYRKYVTQAEGVKNFIDYDFDPTHSIRQTIYHYIWDISRNRFNKEMKVLGKTTKDLLEEYEPQFVKQFMSQRAKVKTLAFAENQVRMLFSRGGVKMPPSTMAKIEGLPVQRLGVEILREGIPPPIFAKLEKALTFKPTEMITLLNSLPAVYWKRLKLTIGGPKDLKILISNAVNVRPYRLDALSQVIEELPLPVAHQKFLVSHIAKGALKDETRKQLLQEVRKELTTQLATEKVNFAPLLRQWREKVGYRREGLRIVGEYERPQDWRGLKAVSEAKFPFKPEYASFMGRIFPKEVVESTVKAVGNNEKTWLTAMSGVAGGLRMVTASLDFSAPFIQGLALFGRNPALWAKTTAQQFRFLAQPGSLAKVLAQPDQMAIRTARINAGGSAMPFEYVEALASMQEAAAKLGKVGKPIAGGIQQTFGRAEAVWTGFGELAKNGLWQSYWKPGMSIMQERELARVIDRMTGAMSTAALGIPRTQRDFESAFMFFSPRYTRAGLAFVADAFKGGMSGNEARKALVPLLYGGLTMYYGACSALGQKPNLDPTSAKFMTVKIGDQNIGVGGITYALMRLGANTMAAGADPEQRGAFLEPFNRFDNPFAKFMFSRSSPLTGMVLGLAIEHKDYLGRPFESIADYAQFTADRVTPLSLQALMPWSEEKVWGREKGWAAFGANVFGVREFPASAWQRREDMREQLSQEAFSRAYVSLNDLEKWQVNQNPEVEALQKEADTEEVRRGRAESVAFINYRRDLDDARFNYVNQLEGLQRAVDDGFMTPYDFRESMSDAQYGYGRTLDFIHQRPEYQDMFKRMSKPQDISQDFIGDVAYDELMNWLNSDASEDEYKLFKFDDYYKLLDSLRAKYGDAVMQYVEDRRNRFMDTLPPLAQEYQRSKEVMRAYWNVKKNMERLFGTSPATEAMRDRLTRQIHERMRLSDPEVAKYYQMFWTQ